jgi:hypothetical protein
MSNISFSGSGTRLLLPKLHSEETKEQILPTNRRDEEPRINEYLKED